MRASRGSRSVRGVAPVQDPAASYGRLEEVSAGKDSTTGHWELMGLVTEVPFPTYPDGFPDELIAEFPHFGPFLAVIPNAQYEGAFPDRDLVWYEITYPRILNFLQGNATLEETLETIEREVNETLE